MARLLGVAGVLFALLWSTLIMEGTRYQEYLRHYLIFVIGLSQHVVFRWLPDTYKSIPFFPQNALQGISFPARSRPCNVRT